MEHLGVFGIAKLWKRGFRPLTAITSIKDLENSNNLAENGRQCAKDENFQFNIDDYIYTSENPTTVKMPYNVFASHLSKTKSNVKSWLKPYLNHKTKCIVFKCIFVKECDCGLNEALGRMF